MPRTQRNAKKCQEPRCHPQIAKKQGAAVTFPPGGLSMELDLKIIKILFENEMEKTITFGSQI